MSALKYLLWLPIFTWAIVACDTGSNGDLTGDGEENLPHGRCWDAPEKCLQWIECAGVLQPDQQSALQAEYGEMGSCWCGTTEAQAQECYKTCVSQLGEAVEQHPTEPLCHGRYCTLDQLDPEQAYGPVVDGACPNYGNSPQLPLQNPFGLPGSVCAPKCGGIAKLCPEHTQTTAAGTCYIQFEGTDYCLPRCWVNPYHFGATGTQCQCGARCQPFGGTDAEGNLRGICTFE